MKAAGFRIIPSSCWIEGRRRKEEVSSSSNARRRRRKNREKARATNLSPLVVHGDERRLLLLLDDDGSVVDKGIVGRLEDVGEILEGVGDDESSSPHGLVLLVGGLESRVGHRSSVSELNLGGEHLGAGSDGPGDDGLLDGSVLDSFDDSVLLDSSNLSEKDEHLALGILLVSKKVVDERGSGVSISSDGDSLVGSVGDEREDVVELVGHSSGLGDVSDGSSSVELGGEDVIHHSGGRRKKGEEGRRGRSAKEFTRGETSQKRKRRLTLRSFRS